MPSPTFPFLPDQQLAFSPQSSAQPSPAADRASLIPALPKPHLPPLREVPHFPPIRAGGRRGRRRLRRGARGLSVALAVTAATLAVSGAHGAASPPTHAAPRGPAPAASRHSPGDVVVRAPVRIADPAVVGLLRPGDHVDVLAASRVVAMGATVVAVPDSASPQSPAPGTDPALTAAPVASRDITASGGALLVLSVTRRTAAALSGAAASTPLAVTLC